MKKKSKTKNKITKAPKVKRYEAHYLAIILLTVLLLEGFAISSTSVSDWQIAMRILDISSSVSQTMSDVALVFQPVTDSIGGVNQFYDLAATGMADVLDLSESNVTSEVSFVTDGISDFYEQASRELAQLLDLSHSSDWPAAVAGASISR